MNNAVKGKSAEHRVAKQLKATRKAGPNSPDLKKGSERIEVKNYKNPLTKKQLQNAYAQNHADVIVSSNGFTDEAIEYAQKHMPTIQLRKGLDGKSKLVKRRQSKIKNQKKKQSMPL
ncbi:restriction endonuclease [Candidatus Nomurabacteria bacterium]|nr:restriction endonuclease [Candidatus Nomurabacteria bacterium]